MEKIRTTSQLYIAAIAVLVMMSVSPSMSFAAGLVNQSTFIAAGGDINIASDTENWGTLEPTQNFFQAEVIAYNFLYQVLAKITLDKKNSICFNVSVGY